MTLCVLKITSTITKVVTIYNFAGCGYWFDKNTFQLISATLLVIQILAKACQEITTQLPIMYIYPVRDGKIERCLVFVVIQLIFVWTEKEV